MGIYGLALTTVDYVEDVDVVVPAADREELVAFERDDRGKAKIADFETFLAGFFKNIEDFEEAVLADGDDGVLAGGEHYYPGD